MTTEDTHFTVSKTTSTKANTAYTAPGSESNYQIF